MSVQVRRYGAEVSLSMVGGREEFDRFNLEDCGVTTIAEIELFCHEVRCLGGIDTTSIAVGKRRIWVLVPHPEVP